MTAEPPKTSGPSRAHVRGGRLDLSKAPSVMESIASAWAGMGVVAQRDLAVRQAAARLGAFKVPDPGFWHVPGYGKVPTGTMLELGGKA